MARFLMLASLLWLAGCGYVGPVMAPSPEIPQQVNDLTAVERGNKIEISFHTPSRTTDRLGIKKFSDIDLRIGPASEPFDYAHWAETAKHYPLNPPPAGDPLDPKSLAVTASIPLDDFSGRRVAVSVRTAIKRGDNYSSWSNRAVFVVTPPLLAPTGVKATASAGGVVLDWNPVPSAERYRVSRHLQNEKNWSDLGQADTPHFVDSTAQFDAQYAFQVVALSGSAESVPSGPEEILYQDTFAPSIPAGVTVLAGPESIEVSWQRSPESDLAGYFVYRSVGGGPAERQGAMLNLPAFSDRAVEHGKTYRYQISSVDKKNNESAKSAAADVLF